ncbi:farnesol dehydrogenase-like [Episyrphus balteatus]|uniref:farnesol dehydrogenase-like n=1 Tax=Episyrphus balteatus TaxID=286459 RepID=UPI0024860B51|nr:farnesol dehydrogenase-like [Episyrphus balteatus]
MERWSNRVAVVTGASSGIGEATAADLCKAGLKVVALARREDRLHENRSKLPKELQSKFYPRKCDVSNEAEVKETFEWIEKTLGGVDILVNNAGVNRIGKLVDMDTADIDTVLNTNVKGLVYCTQAAYKSMKERNFAGHIVHINSIAGQKPIDMGKDISFNIYPASKYAVTAINETLRNELRHLGTKIKTTSISPGLVRTEIGTKVFFDLFGDVILNPEDVSQAILYAISTPPHVQIHEITIKPVGEEA